MTAENDLLLEAVVAAARLAGDVALRLFRAGTAIEWKPDGTEVTAGDRAAERAVREWISARFARDNVIGEEFGVADRRAPRTWYIDPIDGTKSFVRGVPFWGAMVGVAVNGRVRAGAVCCPAVGEIVAAAGGAGCWHNGARAAVSTVDRVDRAAILVTDARFRTHPERAPRWESLSRESALARTWGDCYGYLLVATGRADVMADDRLNPWDVAALLPIMHESGGVLTDWAGRSGVLGDDALATNGHLAAAVRARLGVPYDAGQASR
jgi:histidinol-phosphatase